MKMRYFAILLLSAVLLTGCGGGTSTKNGTTAVTTTTESKDKTDLADLMSTQDYSCTVDDSFMYYVMYVTNNSDKVVSIDLNVTALDSSGSMVGSSSDGTKAVAPGQTAGIWTTFDEWDKIDSFDYTLSVSEEKDLIVGFCYIQIVAGIINNTQCFFFGYRSFLCAPKSEAISEHQRLFGCLNNFPCLGSVQGTFIE